MVLPFPLAGMRGARVDKYAPAWALLGVAVVTGISALLAALVNALTTLRTSGRQSNLQERVETHAELRTQLDALRGEISANRAEMKDLATRVRELERSLHQSEQEKLALTEQNGLLRLEIKQVVIEKAELAARVTELEGERASKAEQVRKLAHRLALATGQATRGADDPGGGDSAETL